MPSHNPHSISLVHNSNVCLNWQSPPLHSPTSGIWTLIPLKSLCHVHHWLLYCFIQWILLNLCAKAFDSVDQILLLEIFFSLVFMSLYSQLSILFPNSQFSFPGFLLSHVVCFFILDSPLSLFCMLPGSSHLWMNGLNVTYMTESQIHVLSSETIFWALTTM